LPAEAKGKNKLSKAVFLVTKKEVAESSVYSPLL
jgi:hypothetical protein